MKIAHVALISSFLVGCAQGRLDVIDTNGKVIGECSAAFAWHWYGAKDSVNYILNLCAQEQIVKGYTISDKTVLVNDYTLPVPPKGSVWNKITAKAQFKTGNISEQQYGYILAAIEYEYILKVEQAENDLARALISKKDFEQAIEKAKLEFNGT
ncbi:hypothetical protein [Shewanella sp. UCD-KL12]|uniref:hypothetical protein n=1 Tax=Shewanella sp. UCD-KL12 TaxID=1917163 RepID=UPI000970D00C|nr:hypothetical protein [Shewanella sp. UCD-KL12]